MSETAYLPEPACAASQVVEGQRDKRWLWAAILILAAAVPYISTLGYGFVYDDGPQIVENRDLLSLKSVPGFFAHSIEKAAGFHGEGLPVFYRPLFFFQ